MTQGICPHCEWRTGPVGSGCPGDGCAGRYHFIPKEWFESAKNYAHRKGRPVDPLLGRKLDRYLLAGKLGEGGMGAVYLAFQEPLNREVALKIISGMELTEAGRLRFEREARVISRLDHPNIVKLHDYGIGRIEFEIPYMALEYVRHGRTLRRALADVREEAGGRIPGDVVLAIFMQILNALTAAHELGVVHRDMKPDNVMVVSVHGNPYFVKVLDFGLAKAVQDLSGFDGTVSRAGQILGTPYYMAPEQASGRHVDERADLYAVATMLFEVFTGFVPFDGASTLEILLKKTDPRWWPMSRPEVRALPQPLQAFLSRGLQPNPDHRFQTASEMLEALRGVLSRLQTTAVGLSRPASSSSQDRPVTPQSPPASAPESEDLGPTMPLEEISGEVGKPESGLVSDDDGSPRTSWGRLWSRSWPWIATPAVALLVGVGFAWFLAGRGGGPGVAGPEPRPGITREDVGPVTTSFPGPPPTEAQGRAGAVSEMQAPEASLANKSGSDSMSVQASARVPTAPQTTPYKPDTTPPVSGGKRERIAATSKKPTAEENMVPTVQPVAIPKHLSFEIRTSPPGAEVTIDGNHIGTTPARYDFEVRSEEDLNRVVRVEVVRPGYRAAAMAVRLRDAVGRGQLEIPLVPEYKRTADDNQAGGGDQRKAWLNVVIWPDGTRVTIDGRYVGKAPLREPLRLDPGEHIVHLACDGFSDKTEKVRLDPGEAKSLRVALVPAKEKKEDYSPPETMTAVRPDCNAACKRLVQTLGGSGSFRDAVFNLCTDRCRSGDTRFSACAWKARTLSEFSDCMSTAK